jgi:hypothetical protein
MLALYMFSIYYGYNRFAELITLSGLGCVINYILPEKINKWIALTLFFASFAINKVIVEPIPYFVNQIFFAISIVATLRFLNILIDKWKSI